MLLVFVVCGAKQLCGVWWFILIRVVHIVSHSACWFVLTQVQVQVTQTMLYCGVCWSMWIQVVHLLAVLAGLW